MGIENNFCYLVSVILSALDKIAPVKILNEKENLDKQKMLQS